MQAAGLESEFAGLQLATAEPAGVSAHVAEEAAAPLDQEPAVADVEEEQPEAIVAAPGAAEEPEAEQPGKQPPVAPATVVEQEARDEEVRAELVEPASAAAVFDGAAVEPVVEEAEAQPAAAQE